MSFWLWHYAELWRNFSGELISIAITVFYTWKRVKDRQKIGSNRGWEKKPLQALGWLFHQKSALLRKITIFLDFKILFDKSKIFSFFSFVVNSCHTVTRASFDGAHKLIKINAFTTVINVFFFLQIFYSCWEKKCHTAVTSSLFWNQCC